MAATEAILIEGREQSRQWIAPAENVLPYLRAWQRKNVRTTLITLVGIDGSSPRMLGAQMAIAGDGRAAGHISSGCLEGVLLAEAEIAMRDRENRLVRYGKGSKYIDIVLPCGSGLDIYFDQNPAHALIEQACEELAARQAVALKIDLTTGQSTLVGSSPRSMIAAATAREGNLFVRSYTPRLKLMIAGTGPAVMTLARLAQTVEMEVELLSPEIALVAEAAHHGIAARELIAGKAMNHLRLDPWSAAVCVFHDHAWELPLLRSFLKSQCFYLGAVGSRRTHEVRLKALAGAGISQAAMARLRAPVGLIPHAKQPQQLAVSILAEIMASAKESGLA